ncbi:hypothetical protein BDD12DRAFT_816018 [Trichophaea hybrida]|nr:hypothetical protein BDD12DRAFT_816018 [Trichophaea hybrida]
MLIRPASTKTSTANLSTKRLHLRLAGAPISNKKAAGNSSGGAVRPGTGAVAGAVIGSLMGRG